jgi:hypothetical protein
MSAFREWRPVQDPDNSAERVSRALRSCSAQTTQVPWRYSVPWRRQPAVLPVEVHAAPVREPTEIETVIAMLGRDPGGGLIVPTGIFTSFHRLLIIELAGRHRLLEGTWEYVEAIDVETIDARGI